MELHIGTAGWQVTAALWCIFDNTAAGHAFGDALALRAALAGGGPRTLAASLSRAPRAPC